MDRLARIKTATALNSSNLSMASGYETANDNSINSQMFYSFTNDETLEAEEVEVVDLDFSMETVKSSMEPVSPVTVKAADKIKKFEVACSTPSGVQTETRFDDISGIHGMPDLIDVIDDSKATVEDDSVIFVDSQNNNSQKEMDGNGPKILADFFANLDVKTPTITITAPAEEEVKENVDQSIVAFKSNIRKSVLPPVNRERVLAKSRISVLTALSENRVASPINRNKRKSVVKNIPNVLKDMRANNIKTEGVVTRRRSLLNLGVIKDIAKISPTKATTFARKTANPAPPSPGTQKAAVKAQQSLKTRQSLIPPKIKPLKSSKTRQSLIPPPVSARPSTAIKITAKPTVLGKRKSILDPKNKSPIKKACRVPSPRKAVRKSVMPPPTASKSLEGLRCHICNKTFRLESNYNTHMKTHADEKKLIASDLKCKYCDKKFEIKNALINHLRLMCPKIPAGERRKLLLPSHEELAINNKSSDSSTASSSGDKTLMRPPTTNKTKHKIHSGINRTPSKKILCYTCKRGFSDLLIYTEHASNCGDKAGDGK